MCGSLVQLKTRLTTIVLTRTHISQWLIFKGKSDEIPIHISNGKYSAFVKAVNLTKDG